MKTYIHGLMLNSPVIVAAGTFGEDGYGKGILGDYPWHKLGAVVMKTTTKSSQKGNYEPRVWHIGNSVGGSTYLNSVGLENPGIFNIKRKIWYGYGTNIILSIAAYEMEEFVHLAMLIDMMENIAAIEINLSCPNTYLKTVLGHSVYCTNEAVSLVRANTKLPIIVKLPPNVPDITEIANAAVDGGADALTICNTIPAMKFLNGEPVLGNTLGGMSGAALRPIAVALVYKTAKEVSVPIIGCGGVFTAAHAREFFAAGASAVQVGTANMEDIMAPFKIIKDLENGV